MTRNLLVHRAGPGITVQDMGRPGYLGFGLSRGGAADRRALFEGAAILGQSADFAALEMAGFGGEFEATEDLRIALTGAPMRATIDGERVTWNASCTLPAGSRLSIGAPEVGTYGYLHVGGGIETPVVLGARSAHLAAGIGSAIAAGSRLPLGADTAPALVGNCLTSDTRFDGGVVRVVAGPQTGLFPPQDRDRFAQESFRRDARGNRMGVRFLPSGDGFSGTAGLSILSEMVTPGDIQITGDGTPFVLMSECQTTGGYPRIGTVIAADLPRVAQAQPGATLRFTFLSHQAGVAANAAETSHIDSLRANVRPLIRDPATMRDLLSYQLISGATAGHDDISEPGTGSG